MRIITCIIIGCFFISQVIAQTKKYFVINGNLYDLKDGTLLYLIHNSGDGNFDTVSKTVSKGGVFKFKGHVKIEGEPYFIKFATFKSKEYQNIALLLENTKVKITGSVDAVKTRRLNIEGLSSAKDYSNYINNSEKVNEALRYSGILQLALSTDCKKIIWDQDKKYLNDFYSSTISSISNNSLLKPFLILSQYSNDSLNLNIGYTTLSSRAKNSFYGKEIANRIENLRNNIVGSEVLDLFLVDSNKKQTSLKSIVRESKLTILNFWASWCAPCRDELPIFKRLFEKYHSKGLNIIGYSVDENDSLWKNTVIKANLSWYNFRDKNKTAQRTFGFAELPTTYYIDQNGKIVAINLSLDQIETQVVRVIGN